MTGKRVVVTGGSGHLGRPLLDLLAPDTDLVNADLEDGGGPGEFVRADVMDPEALRAVTRGADAVVHLAGIDLRYDVPPGEFIRVNALGTWNLLQAAAENGVPKVLLCSSVAAIGLSEMRPDWRPACLPVDESHDLRPVHAYSLGKAMVEQMGLSFHHGHGMTVLCMRPLAVVSPANLERFIAGIDDPARHWLFYYVMSGDLARGFRAGLEAEGLGFESFLLGAADSCLPEPTLAWYQRRMGALPGRLDRRLYEENPRASVFSSAKAKALLGWEAGSDFLEIRAAFEKTH